MMKKILLAFAGLEACLIAALVFFIFLNLPNALVLLIFFFFFLLCTHFNTLSYSIIIPKLIVKISLDTQIDPTINILYYYKQFIKQLFVTINKLFTFLTYFLFIFTIIIYYCIFVPPVINSFRSKLLHRSVRNLPDPTIYW